MSLFRAAVNQLTISQPHTNWYMCYLITYLSKPTPKIVRRISNSSWSNWKTIDQYLWQVYTQRFLFRLTVLVVTSMISSIYDIRDAIELQLETKQSF